MTSSFRLSKVVIETQWIERDSSERKAVAERREEKGNSVFFNGPSEKF
jgi:hypothetical protein